MSIDINTVPSIDDLLANLKRIIGDESGRLNDVIDFDVVAVRRLLGSGFLFGVLYLLEQGLVENDDVKAIISTFKSQY